MNTAKAKPAPAEMEYAGNFMGGDTWLKIGLSRAEVKLITRAGKAYKFKKCPTASMVRRLVMMALLNLPALEESWNANVRYCEAEDIFDMTVFCEQRAAQVLKQIRA